MDGLITDDEHEVEEGIPLLRDIPIVGKLFSKSSAHKFKKELIFMITLTQVDRNGRE
jgi:type II secretory pathway component GspD/PulD (secretin)